MRNFPNFVTPTILLFLVLGPIARATDGDLDPSFGSGGKVVTDFGSSSDFLRRVAVQPDGKIIAIGTTSPSHKVVLARYNPDGMLDASFGNGGKVISVATMRESAAGLLILPDGKIMVSGSIDLPSSQDTSFLLLRFNSDGSVDTSFGSGGMVATDVGPVDDQANALALQSDGKIVVAGRRGIQIEPSQQRKGNVALARYNPDGSLDTSFGNGGKVVNDFGQGLESYALQLIIQPDGKLVIAGGSSYEFLVARYNSDGTLDTTFGGSGYRFANFSSNWDGATDAVLQPDGKIVLVGWSELNSPYDSFALARFNPDGSFDQTFGNGGHVLLVNQGDLNAVALQNDGKLIALGSSNYSSDPAFHLLRFAPDGSLDSTFGSGGKITTSFGQPTEGVALAFQADGKLLAGGLTSSDQYFQNSDFALARYEVGGTAMQLTSAASRKAHGNAGTFDVNLPLTGTPGVECRSTGGNHTLVFTFNSPLVDGEASVAAGSGNVAETTYTGNVMTVNLTNVPDAQTITVTLQKVTDGTHVMPDCTVQLRVLLGDANGDGVVDSADATVTRNHSGQALDATNFRADYNLDGSINAADATIVRARSGNSSASVPRANK